MSQPLYDASRLAESELIRRAVSKDETAIRAIIRHHNRRLFRVARSMIPDDGEAEDVLQEAYLRAFSSLATFCGQSSLSTWLTRIVVNEALQRLRRHVESPIDVALLPQILPANVIPFPLSGDQPVDPERAVAQRQIIRLLERAIDALPVEFRTVFVARIVEELSIEETAELLDILPETVKTRLHRARRLLKVALSDHVDPLLGDVFPFDGHRCDRLANAVVERLKKTS